MDFLNVQDQPKFVWPASFALSRAYTDQLERWKGLRADKVSAVRTGLSAAEAVNGAARARRADCARDAGPRIHERIDRPAARAVAVDVDQGSGEGQLIASR